MKAGAEVAQRQTDKRFETKRDPDGDAWDDWSDNYAATRDTSIHSLLIDTGHKPGKGLRHSIEADVEAVSFEIFTDMAYADPVQKRRPFIGAGTSDIKEIEETIMETLAP